MKSAKQQVWKPAVVVALGLLSPALALGQDWQFVFDGGGNLTVQAAEVGALPQILSQPQNQVVSWGQSASFSVVATDTRGLSYQWLFNGTALPGATADSLLLTNASTADEGGYSVVLANGSGSVTSALAFLMLDSDSDGLGDGWEQTYFGTLGQYSSADSDGDGVSNGTEFQDGTDPTDRASAFFRLTLLSDGGQVTVTPSRFRFTNGETVTLNASAFSPHSFHGWAGDIEATNNPITLTMTNNKTLFAYLSSYDIQWRSGANGDWHNRANWNPRIVPASNDNVFVTGTPQITNNSDVVCRDLMVGGPGSAPSLWGSGNLRVLETCDWLGGTLAANGVLTIITEMNWAGGTMGGSGRTLIAPGATLNIANPTDVTLRTRTLENAGTILWTGDARIFVDGGIITNRVGALFEAQNAAFFAFGSGFGAGRFDNAGTFRKTSTGTTTFDATTAFNNYAAVEIQNGTLAVRGGGRNDGAMVFQSGTTLNLGGSTFSSSAASSISGAGSLSVSGGAANMAGLVNLGGTHTFSGATANLTGNYICTNNILIISAGTANFSGTGLIMPATVSLSSGSTLNGSSELTVLNAFNWTGGTMSGSGRTVIVPGATLNISGSAVHFLTGRTVENGGTILWSGGFLTMGGATITNRANALFDNQTAVTVNSGGGNRFDNAGTFRKLVNAGTATWPVTFNNSGLVEIGTGRLALDGAGTNTSTMEIAAGASLNLSSGGIAFISTAGSSISGAGDFIVSGNTTLSGLVNPSGTHLFSGGVANLNGNYICTNSPATISGSTVNFNSTSAVAVVHFTGGTLSGSGVLNVLEMMNWTAGFMGGSGRTVIAPGATLNLMNSVAVTLNTRTLENGGTVIWTGAGNLTASATVITNRPGALFELRNNTSFAPQGFFPWRFDNAGTLRKTMATGTSTFAAGVSLTNYNRVEIRSGILAANGGYISTGNALLNCAIGGTNTGTGFGQLRVAGAVNLNGSLGVDLANGFVPAVNDSFPVVTAGTRNGSFSGFSYPSNDVTMVISNAPTFVLVHVTDVAPAKPVLFPPELSGTDLRLIWTAIPNTTYRLEFKPDLSLIDWQILPGDVASLSNRASKLDVMTSSNRFYRVRVVP